MLGHLYEIVQHRARVYPNAVAVGGQQGLVWKTLDSQQLLELVDVLADELAAAGVREGDRVVIWAPSQWRTSVYLFALWKLGAITVPFDRETNPEAGARILESVEPRLVIAGYGERPSWAQGREVTEWWEPGERGPHPATLEERRALPGSEGGWARPAEELATVVFTSGTTGDPKGCMITHANLCWQVDPLGDNVPLGPDCRLASILPLSHLFELMAGLLYPLYRGAEVHYIPSRRPPDILRVLSEQRITHMMAVPQLLTLMGSSLEEQLRTKLPGSVYRALNAAAERLPIRARQVLFWMVHQKLGGHFRLFISGGAALPAETQHLWERLGVNIVQGYGTSECSPSVALALPDGSTPMGSVGKPIRGVEVRLGPDGELQVRGPNVMRGYWKDPVRTAEVLQDGWYSTGDLATIDGDGNIFLSGRAKDLIVLPSGLKVWPQDVEDVLRSEPAIQDAAVIAVPTTSGGATLHAYLIPASPGDRSTDLSALVARGNGRLAQHQRLASATWWPEADFPRTSTLKVRRNLLPPPTAMEAVKVDAALAADDPVGQAVAGAARLATVQPTQTLGELGLDSLGLVELSIVLEDKCDRRVADGDLRLEMTVEQVRKLLTSAPALDGDHSGERRHGPPAVSADRPLWPYTWGRAFRFLSFPLDLLYRYAATRTIVLGKEHLENLPPRVIFAGTHHSFPDMPLVSYALSQSPARRYARRLVPAIAAAGFNSGRIQIAGLGLVPWYGILTLGLHPLHQDREWEASLRSLARAAQAGNAVLIFPQGTHAKPEEERARDPAVRFKTGVAHLAEGLDAAVVPFGVAGTEDMLPRSPHGFDGPVIAGMPASIKRGPLAIAFGTPVRLEPSESPQAFADRLETVCYALTRQAEAQLSAAGGH